MIHIEIQCLGMPVLHIYIGSSLDQSIYASAIPGQSIWKLEFAEAGTATTVIVASLRIPNAGSLDQHGCRSENSLRQFLAFISIV